MNNTSKVLDLVVNKDFCIGCGLCTYKCANKALEMKWNEFGFLIPSLTGECNCDGSCIKVCPFNPNPDKEVRTENEIAELYLEEADLSHPKIGKYIEIYAGYSMEHRLSSSSGGVATYVLNDLLERGEIDYVFSVKESLEEGIHYEYAISSSKQELLKAAKTKYFPVSLSKVFSQIDDLEGRVAIVGVACFIKSVRLVQHTNPNLKNKIPFLVGIICGGVKSSFFTEYLASKAGVKKSQCSKPEFRIKDTNSSANDYSFGCSSVGSEDKKTIKMRAVGDMWGTGLFKANACDFCDDVTTELADISVGDAWLEPYSKDGKGTNVLVTRSSLAESIIKEGIASGKLKMETMSLDRFLFSQQGSFNHRHDGLSYRISRARKKLIVPPKRFDRIKISFIFKMIQSLRMKTRKRSLEVWKSTLNASLFDENMKRDLYFLRKLTTLNHYKRAIKNKFRKI